MVMSLEDKVQELIDVMEELIEVIRGEASEWDNTPVVTSRHGVLDEPEEPEEETPPAEPQPLHPTYAGASQRVVELIALAKEMGYPHLYNDGQLVVDNRVLDEYNRRALGDTIGP
jgi:hypothetical protein